MEAATVEDMIRSAFPAARVDVRSPDGVHFKAEVVDAVFAGKPPLARHRLVYAALGEHVGVGVHGIELRTLTPDEAARLA